ncbi:L,D-transpeptidase [uncultured Massilia sp.]|uniref:L,D-transpeptidase n=1 Tax=uncultured Massilia sp. TaxID=169973 RepID=UPI00258DBD71|nr:L,D-transpeptidase [uncultured Massilia sp.]
MSNPASPKSPNQAPAKPTSKAKPKKRITVKLALQILEAFEGDERIYKFECVTGDALNATRRGKWSIFRKEQDYRSREYKVDMDYAMFFYQGQAIHQYHGLMNFSLMRNTRKYVSDMVGSAGCVRLREADARTLFFWAPYQTEVHVA